MQLSTNRIPSLQGPSTPTATKSQNGSSSNYQQQSRSSLPHHMTREGSNVSTGSTGRSSFHTAASSSQQHQHFQKTVQQVILKLNGPQNNSFRQTKYTPIKSGTKEKVNMAVYVHSRTCKSFFCSCHIWNFVPVHNKIFLWITRWIDDRLCIRVMVPK